MVVLRSKPVQHGEFLKMRMFSLPIHGESLSAPTTSTTSDANASIKVPRSPSASPSDRLSQSLVACFGVRRTGYELKLLGAYMEHIPSRVGRSHVLDDAITCFLDAYSAALRGTPPHMCSNYLLYGNALRSLQNVIEDPVEAYTTETLCAVILIQRIEVWHLPILFM